MSFNVPEMWPKILFSHFHEIMTSTQPFLSRPVVALIYPREKQNQKAANVVPIKYLCIHLENFSSEEF